MKFDRVSTIRVVLPLTALLAVSHGFTAVGADLYLDEVKPLLAEKCAACHGPLRQEGGLRLDAAELILKGGDSGAIVDSKRPEDSLVIERVNAEPLLRMPPPDEGEPLTRHEVHLLRRWIETGTPAPESEPWLPGPEAHWAYQPVRRPEVPEADLITQVSANPIDRFLHEEMRKSGTHPLPQTDDATLLRRVTFDLTGLPPAMAEVEQLALSEERFDYAARVDQLLARPQFGEHWARHWMDVWRYSDWSGFGDELRGSQRHIWRWRDWIVESLNDDKGYDRMVAEMLAADEIAPHDPDVLRATGFLARNYHASNRDIWLDATVEHTAKAFLGMTLNCARCHAHKYDPISQQDYYAFRAIFEPHQVRTDYVSGEIDRELDGLPRAFDADLDAETFLYEAGDEKRPVKEHPLAPAVPSFMEASLRVSPIQFKIEDRYSALRPEVEADRLRAAAEAIVKAEAELADLREARPTSDGPAIALKPEQAFTFISARLKVAEARRNRDQWQKRYQAERLKYFFSESPDLSRVAMEAARLEREHALLTARRASAKSRESFHRKQAEGGDLSKLLKDIEKQRKAVRKAEQALTKEDDQYSPVGEIHPETSTGRRLALARWMTDPQNPLTARVAVNHIWLRYFGEPLVANMSDFGLRAKRPRHADLLDWLAAELMSRGWKMKPIHRLIVTSEAYRRASGGHAELTAQSVAVDPDNETLWRMNPRRMTAEMIRDNLLSTCGLLDKTRGGPSIAHERGEEVFRRSLYFQHANEKQMQFLTTFDSPSPNECYRRTESIVPQQALALANSRLSNQAADNLLKLLVETRDVDHFISQAFRATLGRDALPDERELCRQFLEQHSRSGLLRALLNHNDFITLR
ncbi:PSD1 and planctomycete cytochrome C domain-containing protein [Stratiformator vulcanicus]|uniref:PSD1 and planctomycete cytochrome C domain-containing protein n=1 Tax=Stratiformator vulcanicus TaxID=2527980 RepID=UPI002877E88F|nr:PSD1 and planctomycete cytochrome C domain-containing protein [Stratiformator vulcanicus]